MLRALDAQVLHALDQRHVGGGLEAALQRALRDRRLCDDACGIDIGAIDSELEGDLDLRGFLGISNDVRKGYREVCVKVRVQSDASPKLLRELAEYSPVYDVVSRSLPVKVSIETY